MNADRGGTAGPTGGRDDRAAEQLAELLEEPHGVDGAADDLAESLVTDAELEELLSLASSLREVPAPRPGGSFRTALRERLVQETTRRAATSQSPRPSLLAELRDRIDLVRRSVSLAAASAACAVLIGAVGIVAAAQHAQPDDALYDLKRMTESVRIGFAGDEVQAGRLHLQLAERRLEEVVEGAGDLRSSAIIDALTEMDRHTERGGDLLLDAYHHRGETAVLSDLVAFVERQRHGLRGVIDALPIETVPFAHRSLDLLDRLEHEISQVLFQGCVPCSEGATGPVGSDADAGRCCTDATLQQPGDDGVTRDDGDRSPGAEIDDEHVPAPGSRLRGIVPVDPDVELTDDLAETVEETGGELEDTVDESEELDDTVDDVVDEVDEPLDDLTDLLGD